MKLRLVQLLFFLFLPLTAHAAPLVAAPVALEEMTSPEIRAAIDAGATSVLVPTGGLEQNGPHLPLGKHNWIVGHNALEVARAAGNMLVAPVLPYVPQGDIENKDTHMAFAGTASVREAVFAGLLEDIARSMKHHGFKTIYFMGDHGDSIPVQQRLAGELTKAWTKEGVRVVNLADYYRNNGQNAWVAAQKVKAADPQAHGGFADTSEMMTLRPDAVRTALIPKGAVDYSKTGLKGSPEGASAGAGVELLKLKINAAVEQIRRDRTPAQ